MQGTFYSAYRPSDIARDRAKVVRAAIPHVLFVLAFVVVGLAARFGG